MAKLPDAARESAKANMLRANQETATVSKAVFRDVVNKLDDFIDESVAGFKARLDSEGLKLTDTQLDLCLIKIAEARIEGRS